MIEDFDRCYRAVQSKDPRFDGWFFTAVTSTGIYCRPSCPAMTPRQSNVRFYPTAAAAQQAGFRACKRCRPDAAPGSPEWDSRADVVARAMRLIADGTVDREGVPGLASALGYSTRQVERLLQAELGAGPVAVARAQRAQTARVLIEGSGLGMADVAFAAGFSSIRQFNDTVRAVFATTPTELRRRGGQRDGQRDGQRGGQRGGSRRPTGTPAAPSHVAVPQTIDLRLPFRRPLCPDNLFGHLAATAVPGVEEVRDGAYRRTLRLPHGPGVAALRPRPDHVSCRLALTDLRDLTTAVARCRRLLDLDADPEAVEEALCADPALQAVVRKAPGRRVPRTVDEAEMALRAVIGQQVSTASARTHAGRLVVAHGTPVDDPDGGLTHLFPEPGAVAEAGGAALLGPARRRDTLVALAVALASDTVDLGPGCDRDRARAALGAMPGLGPWTVEIVAMRAFGDPDAFPTGDLG
ncbi:MAG TPA: AlkA N-terminal domain-containing protein, partial [Acidimicrobiales bacterium]|nr:AlkA N-terminal domain-containing protein [Acidimicrobiales bacterium]